MIRVADKNIAWRKGMTVTDLLEELKDPHRYSVVRINNQYVSRLNFDTTLIPDEADVFLIPMIAGG